MDLFDLYQQGSIYEAKEQAEAAQNQSAEMAAKVRILQRRTDSLALACQALWELLRERTELTDADLIARMQKVDLRDGAADGRMTPVPVKCPACQRLSNSRREDCLYCGARLPGSQVLERL
ncbi:MAG: hypothetical protein IT580_04585 [Verrucomicrobiales bacterium]|nr:hypothetical protein [Verrucomicrobiales bacterium]